MLDPVAMRQMATAMALAAELAVSVTLGVIAGYWLDNRFGTSPTLLLALSLLGLVVGFVRIVRQRGDSETPDGEPPDSGPPG